MRKYVIALLLSIIFCVSGCNSDNSLSVSENSSNRVESANDSRALSQQSALTSSQPISETFVTSSTNSTAGNQSAENETDISSEAVAEEVSEPMVSSEPYTRDTRISDVVNDPAFGNYGRLIFPVDEGYYSGETLGNLRLTWYNNIDPDKTVEIANYMRSHAEAGDVFIQG